MNTGEIIIYQKSEGNIKIDVRLEEETVWLTQEQMASLFVKGRRTIAEHVKNVFEEVSMPTTIDLQLNSNETRWMKRLSVAYGLSFERSELARFIYPKDIKDPSPSDIWNPKRRCREAPEKDQC